MTRGPDIRLLCCVVALWLVAALGHAAGPPGDQPPLWSFQPPADPPLPTVSGTDWPQTALDHFVLAALEAKGIKPASAADKHTLIRRATFDLTGLPPTPDDVHAFLADDSPDAFARVVDRLLASPRYGERWGRHWLDVARYADSNGMDENQAYANAFRYRDYVIAALNHDKSYDQFIREQIAGDLIEERPTDQGGRMKTETASTHPSSFIPHPSSDRLVATGLLTIGPKMLAEDDPMKMELDIIDEQIDTIGRMFLGMTLGCARCHEHKFDPISTQDYYALAGIFKSTQTMDNFKVVARWHERPLGTDDEIKRQQETQQRIDEKQKMIARVTDAANQAILDGARRRVADYLLAAAKLQRQSTMLGQLRSFMADAAVAAPEGTVVVEAEDYARGNVKKEFAGYGEKIGVIYNRGELPNVAEYDVTIGEARAFQIELRYAAAEPRPVRLTVNGELVRPDAAGKMTGSWFPDTQAWHVEGLVALRAGANTIRLECPGPFPHFDKLALVPRPGAQPAAGTPQSPAQLAAQRGINPEILQQWVRYLDRTRNDPQSVFAAWHALHATPMLSVDPPSRERERPADSPLLRDLQAAAARAVAARYQELFIAADEAWLKLKATPEGKDSTKLPDPDQESLRAVLYDPTGPSALPPKPELYYAAETDAQLKSLRDELGAMKQSFTPLPEAMAVRDGPPQDLRVHIRGNYLTLGDLAPRRFPTALAGASPPAIAPGRSGRAELAEWLADPANPLTGRVMVNRVWRWHFGVGLVRSPDNFGRLGEQPTNQPLLDWLACRFMDGGWSIKSLHRLIMLSATYQMSTTYDAQATQLDPENRLHWRFNRRRLEAEAIRDAILATSGQLDLAMGGSLFTGANRAYVPGYPNTSYDKYDFPRRSVYLPVIRSDLYDVLAAFDFADPSTPNGDRPTTTVAPQALFMLNSKLMREQSRHMAASLLTASAADDAGRMRLAYERAYGRPPSDAEVQRALEFLGGYEVNSDGTDPNERLLRSWAALCRSILAANEFIHID
jgi:hypothetical protein